MLKLLNPHLDSHGGWVKTEIFNTDSIHCGVLLLYVEHVYRFLLFLGALLIRSDHIQAVSPIQLFAGASSTSRRGGVFLPFHVSLAFCWSPATFCDNQILPVHLQPEIGRQVCVAVDYKAWSSKTVRIICKKDLRVKVLQCVVCETEAAGRLSLSAFMTIHLWHRLPVRRLWLVAHFHTPISSKLLSKIYLVTRCYTSVDATPNGIFFFFFSSLVLLWVWFAIVLWFC